MAAIRGSSLPIAVTVTGVDLTGATVTMAFGPRFGANATLTKTTTAGAITIAYDAATGNSTLSLTLSSTETANLVGEMVYTIWVDDGSPGGEWVPDGGGQGSITFANSVQRS